MIWKKRRQSIHGFQYGSYDYASNHIQIYRTILNQNKFNYIDMSKIFLIINLNEIITVFNWNVELQVNYAMLFDHH